MAFSLAVLTGGKSTRFGFDKCAFKLNGLKMVEILIDEIAELFDEVLLVGKTTLPGITSLRDVHPNRGPVGGLETALIYSKYEAIFLVACDMPCISKDVVKRTLGFYEGQDVVCPFIDGKYQTTHAVYSKRLMKTVELELKREKATLTHVVLSANKRLILSEDDFKEIPNFEESFLNLNSPHRMEEVRERYSKRKKHGDIM